MKRKKERANKCTAIICAAGSSTRMGQDKLLLQLVGKPVIARTLEVFQNCVCIDEIVVVTKAELLEIYSDICHSFSKVKKVVAGGETRLHSVIAGMNAAADASLLAVHDAARPLVTDKVIWDAVNLARQTGSAIPAIMPKDTVKEESEGKVHRTPLRANLRLAQTPQVFAMEVLRPALLDAAAKGLSVTDDAQAVELLGLPVFFSQGSEENIKLTTALDLLLAQAILNGRNDGCE